MINNVVVLGVTKSTRIIFDVEFPQLSKVEIEPYNIIYSNFITVPVKLMLDAPRILKVIKQEHQQLQQIVKDYSINVVISDNRFGLHHKTIETVYMTHQLNIKAGIWSFLANRIHRYYIQKFTKIWIPDFENDLESLAGDLSKKGALKNCSYLGPLSRLNPDTAKSESYDYLLLLSGVEPQRSVLEKLLCEKFNHSTKKIVLVRGTTTPLKISLPPNIKVIDLADAGQLAKFIKSADTIICRSGYSTLMDLYTLNKKKMVLIPTPGQAEQEYLAGYWQKKYSAEVVLQSKLHTWKP